MQRCLQSHHHQLNVHQDRLEAFTLTPLSVDIRQELCQAARRLLLEPRECVERRCELEWQFFGRCDAFWWVQTRHIVCVRIEIDWLERENALRWDGRAFHVRGMFSWNIVFRHVRQRGAIWRWETETKTIGREQWWVGAAGRHTWIAQIAWRPWHVVFLHLGEAETRRCARVRENRLTMQVEPETRAIAWITGDWHSGARYIVIIGVERDRRHHRLIHVGTVGKWAAWCGWARRWRQLLVQIDVAVLLWSYHLKEEIIRKQLIMNSKRCFVIRHKNNVVYSPRDKRSKKIDSSDVLRKIITETMSQWDLKIKR